MRGDDDSHNVRRRRAYITIAFERQRPHECTVCADVVCNDCSPHRWHKSCIPDHRNVNDKTMVRVCSKCHAFNQDIHMAISEGNLKYARSSFREHCEHVFLSRSSAYASSKLGGIDSPDDHGRHKWTPLHLAAASNSLETVRWLVEDHRCPLDSKCDDEGEYTPLSLAAKLGRFNIVFYLARRGASCEAIRETRVLRNLLRAAMDQAFLFEQPTTTTAASNVDRRSNEKNEETCLDEKKNAACVHCDRAFGLFRRQYRCDVCASPVRSSHVHDDHDTKHATITYLRDDLVVSQRPYARFVRTVLQIDGIASAFPQKSATGRLQECARYAMT